MSVERGITITKSRYQSNTDILLELAAFIQANPDLRFRQILHILGLDEDHFYQESESTLLMVRKKIQELK